MEIRLNNLSKSFQNQVVLNNISTTFIGPGLYILFGHSGSGKTTLLNIIAGLEKPSSGEVIKAKSVKCGIIFQHHYLLGDLTSYQNVVLPLKINNTSFAKAQIDNFFDQFGIGNTRKRKIKFCSGGEAQRINFIRTLASQPDYILADEPTGSIDLENAAFIKNKLLELSKKILVIIVTHDNKLFASIPANYLYLEKGNITTYVMENWNYFDQP